MLRQALASCLLTFRRISSSIHRNAPSPCQPLSIPFLEKFAVGSCREKALYFRLESNPVTLIGVLPILNKVDVNHFLEQENPTQFLGNRCRRFDVHDLRRVLKAGGTASVISDQNLAFRIVAREIRLLIRFCPLAKFIDRNRVSGHIAVLVHSEGRRGSRL